MRTIASASKEDHSEIYCVNCLPPPAKFGQFQ